MSSRLAYSLREAAYLSSLSVRSLRYLIQRGKLGYAKVGRRVLIPHPELEKLRRRASVKPTTVLDADAPIRPATPKKESAIEPGNPMAPSGRAVQQTALKGDSIVHYITQERRS
jgi:excisionase family DNA binding protein